VRDAHANALASHFFLISHVVSYLLSSFPCVWYLSSSSSSSSSSSLLIVDVRVNLAILHILKKAKDYMLYILVSK
jgi:hypothetical protein